MLAWSQIQCFFKKFDTRSLFVPIFIDVEIAIISRIVIFNIYVRDVTFDTVIYNSTKRSRDKT